MASSSSSSTSNQEYRFDVFLSFRGEDTRNNFTDHLFENLDRMRIDTFRDDQLERGEEIKSELLKTIEEARISVVVFSKNYAHSKWCLDELAKIMECREKMEQIVLPVFYHVDPSDVRKQTGSFGEAFSIHERNVDATNVQRWRDSLTEAGNLIGFHVKDGSESDVIKKITYDIITRLNPRSLYVGKNIVGMNIRWEKLISLININSNDVWMVGIWGIGGIGKTTAAKALFNQISNQFQGASFISNVRENFENDVGQLQLQQQLLNDIQKGKNRKISNVHEGMNAIKKALSSRRVLVVLDDVDNFKQLECLVGKHDWFGQGSRILITTRDRQPLDAHGVDKYYEIEELNSKEALQLFSLYAFKQNFPQEDYKGLPGRIVKYAKGLPLALQVLGSHLCKKTPSEWESELRKLEREPAPEIQNVLKISFQGLDHTQREIFLDIACFFKGQDKDFVSRILDGCDFYAESGFSILCDRCLITILDNKIHMHDLIQQMGRHIVREQNPEEPGERSRLWEHEDVFRVLTRNEGTKVIKGIFLDMSTSKQLQFTSKAFKRMKKLRILKVHQDAKYDSVVNSMMPAEPSKVLLSQEHYCRDFEFPSKELRYLHWDGYPLESLPSNFYAENLVELNLRCSNIKQLWETKLFTNLKVINLSHSKHLKEIPNPSSVPNLEILTLEGCINLESLPRSIDKLRRLKSLCCSGCENLRSFPEIMGNMENLRKLDLNETAVVKLPSSIEHLKGLEDLSLGGCDKLITVPQSICNLTSLKYLNFSGCLKLEKLPEDLKSLKCLEWFCANAVNCQLPSLSGLCSLRKLHLREVNLTQGVIQSNNLKELYLSGSNGIDKGILIRICHLSLLEKLFLNNCNLMDGDIPSELWQLSSLAVLDLSWNHFSSIPASISQLSKLKALGLSHCKNLLQIPELPSSLQLLDAHNSHCTLSSPSSFLPSLFSKFQDFECSSSSQSGLLDLNDTSSYFYKGVSIVIPGISGIPEWIMDQNLGNHVTTNLPQDWYEDKDFLGFALCSVYVPLDEKSEDDFEHGFEDKSEIQSENESDDDEWAHKSEDESENGSAYKSDNKSEDATEDRFEDELIFVPSCFLKCELDIHGHQFGCVHHLDFHCYCECYYNGAVSDQMWVTYYPKVAIDELCHSSQCRRLKASFDGFYGSKQPFKVKKCGIRLIYNQDHQESHTLTTMPDNWNMECLQKLYLDGTAIKEIPSSIDSLSILVEFYTRNCKNLESLPMSICRLKYLQVLCCSGCSKLGSFPEVMENMNNLRDLHLDGTAIQDLPSSIENLKGLEFLDLASCEKLVTLSTHFCNLKSLKTLEVSGCSKLNKFPKSLGSLQCLEHLHARCLGSIASQLLSLSGLRSLRILHLNGSNLMQWSIQDGIFGLYSLEVLDLTNCNLIDDGIADEIFRLSSLQVLCLSRNHISKIPAGISQLSKLRVLGFSHCKMAVDIPELPSSLRSIDVHDCTGLKTLSNPSSLLWTSLFECFKSAIQDLECGNHWDDPSQEALTDFCYFGEGISILIPRSSGIPEWIRHQKKGSRVTTELPRYWYKNKDLLGFALFSIHIPLDNESVDISKDEDLLPCRLKCELTFCGDQFAFLDDLSLESLCECYENDGASGQVWVLYYPKVAIKEKYHSNKWRRLKASFHGYFNSTPVKVEKCGMQLIYAKNDEYNRPTPIQHNDCQENLGDQSSRVEDVNVNDQRSCDDAQNTTRKNHLPIMQYTNGNDPDVQDHEQNYMPRWLNLFFNIIECICCRRQ